MLDPLIEEFVNSPAQVFLLKQKTDNENVVSNYYSRIVAEEQSKFKRKKTASKRWMMVPSL